jgi:site-specific DNA recombinase
VLHRARCAALTDVHPTAPGAGGCRDQRRQAQFGPYFGILEFGDLVIEDYCEPIVDQATWKAVQSRLKASKYRLYGDSNDHPRRQNSNYLLSGLAFCARCGSPLYGHTSGQRNNVPYERYFCTRAKRRRDCGAEPIPRKFLEELVLNDLQEMLSVDNLEAIQVGL